MTRTLPLLVALAAAAALLSGCPSWGQPGHPDGCTTCHDPIEAAHTPYVDAGRCTTCHGGDGTRTLKKRAHVAVPEDWADIRGDALPPAPDGFIRDFAPDQLDALDRDYLKFINPGDIRVLDETCGICHPDHAATMPLSVMATNAGHYWPSWFLAGLQDDRDGSWASFEPPELPENCDDPDDPPPPGAICDVDVIRPPTAEEAHALFGQEDLPEEDLLEFAWRHYLSKNCNTCHQGGFPRNNSDGLYRSSGCTSCHMVYDTGGTYQGADPTLPRGSPPHPKEHVLTNAIPTEQCATCHFQGGRIGLLYRGIREGGFSSDQEPPNAVPIQRTLYGHAPPYYYTDEDSTNDFDETPADVHADPDGDGVLDGMVCADCHVGSDVHGDGVMWSTSKQQVSIRCEDCHGTVRERAAPRADGRFYASRKENVLDQLSLNDAGAVVLTRRMDGAVVEVPQVADILAAGAGSDRMHASMAPDADDWSHTDSLTCDTCHTPQNEYCIGCHVSLDMRIDQVDFQTGLATPGLTRGSRKYFTLDHLLLGQADDGRVQTVHPSQQVQMSVIGSEEFGHADEVVLGVDADPDPDRITAVGEFREAHGFDANIGFMPFFQHTVRKAARPCDDCHRRDESSAELDRIRGVYGYGTGEFMLEGPNGQLVDGLQFLDDDGAPLTTWVHLGTGPVPEDARQRALDVILDAP